MAERIEKLNANFPESDIFSIVIRELEEAEKLIRAKMSS